MANDNISAGALVADLVEALRLSTRAGEALAAALRQLYAGELDKLYPEEKKSIIDRAFMVHAHAATTATDLLQKTRGLG